MAEFSAFTEISEPVDITAEQVDKDERVLKDVVLIKAGKSGNNRQYSRELLQGTVKLFEGAHAFLDHRSAGRPGTTAGRPRSMSELTGTYRNARFENGAIRADRIFANTRAGEDAWQVALDVREGRLPKNSIGLSVSLYGEQEWNADEKVNNVSRIDHVESVDDVINPAAGGAYVESAGFTKEVLDSVAKSLSYEQWVGLNGEFMEKAAAGSGSDEVATELQEAQQRLEKLTAEKAELEKELAAIKEQEQKEEAGRERTALVERLVSSTSLPEAWLKELESQLQEVKTEELLGFFIREERKAAAAGQSKADDKPKVEVKVGGQRQASEDLNEDNSPQGLAPRDDESMQEYQQRIGKAVA